MGSAPDAAARARARSAYRQRQAHAQQLLAALPLAAAAMARRAESAERERIEHANRGESDDPARSLRAWARAYRRIDGVPLELDRFRPLEALYEETHPAIAVIKPAQRGVSEWAVTYAAWALEYGERWAPPDVPKQGVNVGYIFPTQDALRDFSKERFGALAREHVHLARLFGESEYDGITFKQVGDSYLYLRGGWSTSALLSFPADVIILDEFDQLNRQAVALARRRLNASVIRREVAISTPTLPGAGIHARFLASDQRYYEQPCPHCGAWNRYDYFRDVRAVERDTPNERPAYETWSEWSRDRLLRVRWQLVCPACRADLDDAARVAHGRWVADMPDIEGVRGYWIPPLAFPHVDLGAIAFSLTSEDASEVQEAYRSDLGLPYQPKGSQITAAMLAALSHALPGGQLPNWPDQSSAGWRDTTMGVDVGARFHFRISSVGPDNAVYVRAMGTVHEWRDLSVLLAQYKVRRCIVDALPELHAAEAWAHQHPGVVWRALYPRENALAGQLYREDEDTGRISINRTMAMDQTRDLIAAGREHWPAAIARHPDVVTQLLAPVRVVSDDVSGQAVASWQHTRPDHFFHACVYDQVARVSMPTPIYASLAMGAASGWGFTRGGPGGNNPNRTRSVPRTVNIRPRLPGSPHSANAPVWKGPRPRIR